MSIEVSSAKNMSDSRNEMAFSKNSSTQNNIKSLMSVKKAKITTTLKKDCGLSSVSSKRSLVH